MHINLQIHITNTNAITYILERTLHFIFKFKISLYVMNRLAFAYKIFIY